MRSARTVDRIEAGDMVPVEFTVNGTPVALHIPARMTLSDALRDNLGLTGTHIGCEHGVCGMCTVLIDGEASRSCLLFACQVDGAEITTVEGLGRPDDLHPLQEAFGRHHALQCGFCTPGFLMSTYDLLDHDPEVPTDELSAELSGVICRCTGYRNIVEAVQDVAEAHRGGLPGPKNCGRQRTLVGRAAAGSTAPGREETEQGPSEGRQAVPERIQLPSGEPTISVEVTSQLQSPPGDVARVFEDVRLLARCLPGAELTEELGEDWYRGRARVALGPIKLSFDGFAHLLEHQADRIHLLGQAKDTSGGRAQADIRLLAVPDGTGTRLQAQARVYLVGRIAGFGRSLAADVSRRMFGEFAAAVDQAARGQEPESNPKAPSALRILMDALLDRARGLRHRRHGIRHQPEDPHTEGQHDAS
ncbi:2Fe-2S iron-sulfur cluster-binding protein [Sinomonas notoginsengisoli]|uniref:2Fe-2S iron-sulfur cluster-binding protein n=1 Tax=Sinomonas notoginsengisoli TaxID=1457311 RepID=UPI001F36070C|nr:2Fe-2S iron-sulfur cluster-binding protein [Sinomonas notoginsengisoli]